MKSRHNAAFFVQLPLSKKKSIISGTIEVDVYFSCFSKTIGYSLCVNPITASPTHVIQKGKYGIPVSSESIDSLFYNIIFYVQNILVRYPFDHINMFRLNVKDDDLVAINQVAVDISTNKNRAKINDIIGETKDSFSAMYQEMNTWRCPIL